MTTNAKLNRKDVKDDKYDKKAKLQEVEEKIYQTMEVSVIMTELTKAKQRVDELKEQVERMTDERRAEREVHLNTSRKWELDLSAKTAQYEDLLKELDRTRKEHEEKLERLANEKNNELQNMKNEIGTSKNDLNRKITELNEELKGLQEFREKREEYFATIDRLQKKSDELVHDHNDKLKRIDGTNVKTIQMMQDKHEKEINQIVHEAKKDAEKQIGDMERKIWEDNKKLTEDLEEYKREIRALKKDKEKAVDCSRLVKVNVSIQEDEIIEYQALHARQQSKIKKLKEKVETLKGYIVQEVSKHAKEIEATKYQCQIRIDELEIHLKNIREELGLKTKENKSLKLLSQMILDQRSEVEGFLIETLDYIKEEVRKQKQGEKRVKLPDIWNNSRIESTRKRNWEKVDFSTLDWDEKEKILQILFSKMNSGALPVNWRSNSLNQSNESLNKTSDVNNHIQKSTHDLNKTPSKLKVTV